MVEIGAMKDEVLLREGHGQKWVWRDGIRKWGKGYLP